MLSRIREVVYNTQLTPLRYARRPNSDRPAVPHPPPSLLVYMFAAVVSPHEHQDMMIKVKLWKLIWERWRIDRQIAKERDKLVKRKASGEEFARLDFDEYSAMKEIENAMDWEIGTRLSDRARALDVDIPPINDLQMWYHDENGRKLWFTPKGRAHVRKLIDEEKARRFEVKTRWVTKLIIPLLAALIGIIGALTGLVAVLQHKK